MKQRSLAKTGVTLSASGLGGMPLSLASRPSEADAIKVIHAALDAGMDFIDTADVYCRDDDDIGHNERLINKAVASWPGEPPFVATKGGLTRPGGSWRTDGRPEHIRRACELSLRALGTECIDLYQLHAPDDDVPFEDSVGAFAKLADAGKIRFFGLSNVSVDEIETARSILEVVSVQNRANPFDRHSFDNGVAAYCHQKGITFLPHSPVGGHRNHRRTPVDPVLTRIANRHQISTYEVCLAWLLALSPYCIPIPGASRVESAVSSARAADVMLSAVDLAEMEAAFPTGPVTG